MPTSLNRALGTLVTSFAILDIALGLATAFQQAPCGLKPPRLQRTARFMAETSYPYLRQTGDSWERGASFFSPLFQENEWSRRTHRRRFPSSSLIFGSSFSFLEESNMYDAEDESLSYLPSEANLTPKTKDLLKRVTSQYVNGDEPAVQVEDVLEVIDEEYQSYDVPMTIGEVSFDVSSTGEDVDADAPRILSFAALHGVPRDIAILLLGPETKTDKDDYTRCRTAFATGGWKDVRFEKGLAIRLKRQFVQKKTEKYAPLPRSWLTPLSKAVRMAEKSVTDAAYTTAPPRRLLSREEFLASMEEELSAESPLGLKSFRDALAFFPRQNKMFKKFKRTMTKQTALLKQAGFSGLLSYFALSMIWYTLSIMWQWRRESSTVAISRAALGTALRRFGKVFVSAFLGAQLTRLPRIQVSLALAPFWSKVLKATQQRLRLSETKAFGILVGIMLLSCLGVWTVIVLGDAAILRAWVISGVQHQAEILQMDTGNLI